MLVIYDLVTYYHCEYDDDFQLCESQDTFSKLFLNGLCKPKNK